MKKSAVSVLLRKELMIAEDWLVLIEARRDMIKPFLNRCTLRHLGEMRPLASFSSLEDDRPQVDSSEGLDLKLQGIFAARSDKKKKAELAPSIDQRGRYTRLSSGSLMIWGLARSGNWIIADVKFMVQEGECSHQDRQRATQVEIRQVALPEMLDVSQESPRQVLATLSTAVDEWAREKQKLVQEVTSLASAIAFEETLIGQVRALEIL